METRAHTGSVALPLPFAFAEVGGANRMCMNCYLV